MMLRTCNGVGQFIHVDRQTGETFDARNDLTVFIPDDHEWTCTIQDSPDKPSRCFVIEDIQELRRIIHALELALVIIEEKA